MLTRLVYWLWRLADLLTRPFLRCRKPHSPSVPLPAIPIDSQHEPGIASLPWGRWGHLGRQGCGPAAVFDLMLALTGDPSQTLQTLERMGAPVCGGLLGASPQILERYLRQQFSSVTRCRTLHELEGGDGLLLLYRRGLQLHYVPAVAEGDGYRFRNDPILQQPCLCLQTYAAALRAHNCVFIQGWRVQR